MKKIVASVSLVALGASSINAVYGQGLEPKPAKPWNISATLRGFYDDNVDTAYGGAPKTDTFGLQITPALGVVWDNGQTSVKANYTYSLLYYGTKPPRNPDNYDQTHTFNAALDHAFSERYSVSVTDSFVIGQEPDMLRTGNAINSIQRLSGDNIRNYGTITFNAELTRLLSLEAGYANSFFDYHAKGALVSYFFGIPVAVQASPSGLLDRIEHVAHIDSLWHVQPQTALVAGYQYAQVDYTGDEPIGVLSSTGTLLMSDSRNNRGHYGYVGINQNFSPDLAGAVRGGVKYTDYYNDPSSSGNNNWSPYVQLSLTYNYAPESIVQAGFTYDRNATDVVGTSANNYVKDVESATFFGTLRHRIVPDLFGSLTGQIQNSTFNGGSVDGKSETYYLVGLNLQYQFNQYVSADVGYNFDHVDSQIGRSYYRNRVYLGLTASY